MLLFSVIVKVQLLHCCCCSAVVIQWSSACTYIYPLKAWLYCQRPRPKELFGHPFFKDYFAVCKNSIECKLKAIWSPKFCFLEEKSPTHFLSGNVWRGKLFSILRNSLNDKFDEALHSYIKNKKGVSWKPFLQLPPTCIGSIQCILIPLSQINHWCIYNHHTNHGAKIGTDGWVYPGGMR